MIVQGVAEFHLKVVDIIGVTFCIAASGARELEVDFQRRRSNRVLDALNFLSRGPLVQILQDLRERDVWSIERGTKG